MKSIIITTLILLNTHSFAKDYIVEMHSSKSGQTMTFSPILSKIKSGDTVTFKPTVKGHTTRSIFVPKGASKWDGGIDEKVTVTFEKEGVYLFECKNHGIMGMNGAIIVGNPSNLKKAKDFFEKYRKKLIMNKDRLKKVLDGI